MGRYVIVAAEQLSRNGNQRVQGLSTGTAVHFSHSATTSTIKQLFNLLFLILMWILLSTDANRGFSLNRPHIGQEFSGLKFLILKPETEFFFT